MKLTRSKEGRITVDGYGGWSGLPNAQFENIDVPEKAAEAAVEAADAAMRDTRLSYPIDEPPMPEEQAAAAVAAADPHLRRAHFEEFREAVLSDEALEADAKKRWLEINGAAVEQSRIGIEAALDKAQELLEGDRG